MAKATGKQIREAVEYWRLALGLEDWVVTVQIGRMPNGDYGSAEVSVPYKRAHLRFYPQGIHEAGETVDQLACHELGHLLTESLAAEAMRLARSDKDRATIEALEESLTTEIERLILRLHKRPRSH